MKSKKTYTVQGHSYSPTNGQAQAFWTRTGLSKHAAVLLMRDQRASGGFASILEESNEE